MYKRKSINGEKQLSGLGAKIKRGIKNPRKVLSHNLFKFDHYAGKKLYGNTAGLRHNLGSKIDYDKKNDPSLETKNPTLYHLLKNQFAIVDSKYDPTLLNQIKLKYDKMIDDDKYSILTSAKNNITYARFLRLPVKDIPKLAELITDKIREIVYGYFNSNFMIKEFSIGRIYHAPIELDAKNEMYASHWHCDFRNTDELKLAIYLSDVTELDGGFRIISVERTKQLLKQGFVSRDEYNLSNKIMEDPNYVTEVTGSIGTAFFSNNNLCLHRSGIPALDHTRDRITIVFVPSKKPLGENWPDSFSPHMIREYKM